MLERSRCKSCGYYHVGPAPEVCPVCGAVRSFVPYEGPGDLTGTRTRENLAAAFAGESQANRRYTLFMRIAALGNSQAATEAFDHALTEETAHALGHLAYMGGFGVTTENLTAAVEGEGYETVEMYPSFADIADAEGFPEIAQYFRNLGFHEKEHRTRFEKALAELGE